MREYERRYHYVTEEIEVELSVVRVRGRGLQDRPGAPRRRARSGAAGAHAGAPSASGRASWRRPSTSATDSRPGATLAGPAIVEQLDSTTVVPPGWSLRVDAHGNLLVSWLEDA